MSNYKTCYEKCENLKKECKNTSCRYWHLIKGSQNCIVNKSKEGPFTLQEVGDLFGITRMRICQIEKQALDKVKNNMEKNNIIC